MKDVRDVSVTAHLVAEAYSSNEGWTTAGLLLATGLLAVLAALFLLLPYAEYPYLG